MSTRTLMTAAEFERLPDDGNQHELDEGELIVAAECGYRLSDDTVRGPDVVFTRRERLSMIDFDHYSKFAPALVIEILSPEVNARQFNRKIGQYLNSGVHTLWVLDPDSETVNIYQKDKVRTTPVGSLFE